MVSLFHSEYILFIVNINESLCVIETILFDTTIVNSKTPESVRKGTDGPPDDPRSIPASLRHPSGWATHSELVSSVRRYSPIESDDSLPLRDGGEEGR